MLLFAAMPAMSQITHTANGAVDENANALIKKASAKMSGTVGFTVTVVNRDADKKETYRQKAEVVYNAPRYRVKAGELEMYCDGKSVWQVNKTANEVVVTNMTDNDDDLTNPAKLLANYSKTIEPNIFEKRPMVPPLWICSQRKAACTTKSVSSLWPKQVC